MYAIIKAGGSQHKVRVGDELVLPQLKQKAPKTITFDQVLLVSDGSKISLGKPRLKKVSVKAKVVDHFKGKKLRVATYKAKSRYRRVKGSRAHLTRVKITSIVVREKKTSHTKTK